MHKLFTYALAPAVIGLILSCGNHNKAEVERPNILFVFADDQAYDAVHALGNEEIITPNLDRLVENGVTFTHAYNMGAWQGAVCIASRTMLSTGRSVWRANKLVPQLQDTVVVQQHWGNLLRNAGYDTYMAGKWHVAADIRACYSNLGTVRDGLPGDAAHGYNRPRSASDTTWLPWDTANGGYWQGAKHWSEVLGDDAVQFIREAGKKEAPFFMYLAFNAPHDPRQSPKEFVDLYPIDNISVPKTFLEEYPDKDSIGCGEDLRDERLAPFPRTPYAVRVHRQEYYAIISHLDKQVGRIIDALRQSGKMDNTYIFYTADHGLSCGNYGLMGKQNMYDCSIRAPLMVIGPDLPKGKKEDSDVYLQDIMATSLELAGITKPDYVEFKSFLKLAKGETNEGNYPAIYGCYKDLQRMIRADGYKLIVYPKVPKILLFDLTADPLEMNDLSEKPEFKEKVKTMFNRLVQLQQEMDDELDLKQTFPSL
ncbi:MAG: sulfatase-like hydrolase/transferase [Mangrovibacterium sp.]